MTPSQGTYTAATGVWVVGSLARSGAGATATLLVPATVTQAGAHTYTARQSAPTQPDPNPANDQSGVQVVSQPAADLTLTVDTAGASVVPGTPVTYTLTVTNNVTVATTSNTPPVAVEDVGTTRVDIPLTLPVLGNDRDADGDVLTVTNVTAPVNGTVERQPDGTVAYTPRAGFVGVDTFRYTISDGCGGTATALVTILMAAAADALVTPHADEVIAGDAVAVATFNLPTLPTVRSVRALTTLRIPTDTVAVRFQYQPVDTTVWHDMGDAVTPPFFRVSWDTTQRPDGAYLMRALASRATGALDVSQPVRIRINNVATVRPPDIVETPAFRMQRLPALQVQVLYDANGNGQLDANEPLLATATVPSVLDPITLTLTAPLDLPPQTTTYALVALQIDGNGAGTRSVASRRTGWLLFSPVVFALTLFPWRRRLAPWVGLGLVLMMWSLALTSCEGEHTDLTAVVTMPAQSMRAQGAVSGLLTAPEAPLVGATVIIAP